MMMKCLSFVMSAAARMMCSSCCRSIDSPPLLLGDQAGEGVRTPQSLSLVGLLQQHLAQPLPRLRLDELLPFGMAPRQVTSLCRVQRSMLSSPICTSAGFSSMRATVMRASSSTRRSMSG